MSKEQTEAILKKQKVMLIKYYRVFSGQRPSDAEDGKAMCDEVLADMMREVDVPPKPHGGDYAGHAIFYAGQRTAVQDIITKIEKGRKFAHENNT